MRAHGSTQRLNKEPCHLVVALHPTAVTYALGSLNENLKGSVA